MPAKREPQNQGKEMMSLTTLLLLLCVSSAVAGGGRTVTSLLPITSSKPTAYEVLQSYNFPIGLLPLGVIRYDLDDATGKFTAYLNGTCSFSLTGSYDLRYQSTISGTISKNRLSSLKGISVKVLLFWVNIVEVTRDGDELYFSVGILSAEFPVDNFYECPQCGCGLDCVGGGEAEMGSGFNLRVGF